VIHHPSRGSDNNMNALFQFVDLPLDRLTAVDGENPDIIMIFEKPVELLGYLDSQFACR